MIGLITPTSAFGRLARYLETGSAPTSGERVLWVDARDVTANLHDAAREMELTKHIANTKRLGYHLTIAYDPSDVVARDEMVFAVDRTLEALGLRDNMALTVAHGDAYFPHTHTMIARWDYWTARVVEVANSYYIITQTMRDLEAELGVRPAPEPYYARSEGDRGLVRATSLPPADRDLARRAIESATSWAHLQAMLRRRGMRFMRGRSNLLIAKGDRIIRAGQIARGASLAKMEARLGQSLSRYEEERTQVIVKKAMTLASGSTRSQDVEFQDVESQDVIPRDEAARRIRTPQRGEARPSTRQASPPRTSPPHESRESWPAPGREEAAGSGGSHAPERPDHADVRPPAEGRLPSTKDLIAQIQQVTAVNGRAYALTQRAAGLEADEADAAELKAKLAEISAQAVTELGASYARPAAAWSRMVASAEKGGVDRAIAEVSEAPSTFGDLTTGRAPRVHALRERLATYVDVAAIFLETYGSRTGDKEDAPLPERIDAAARVISRDLQDVTRQQRALRRAGTSLPRLSGLEETLQRRAAGLARAAPEQLTGLLTQLEGTGRQPGEGEVGVPDLGGTAAAKIRAILQRALDEPGADLHRRATLHPSGPAR